MLKRRKWNDWVILEDTNTGQKSFALPTPKTAPFTNWSWSETNAAAPRSESPELHPASRDKCALYTNCIPIPHAQT